MYFYHLIDKQWASFMLSLFTVDVDEFPGTECCKHNMEVAAAMDNEPSVQDCFFGKEMVLCWEQALEQTPPLDLCSAQLQFLWYGLRSITVSCIDMLPSSTHWNIIPDAPKVFILLSSSLKLKILYECLWGQRAVSVFVWLNWTF